jgi:hypothetical protein
MFMALGYISCLNNSIDTVSNKTSSDMQFYLITQMMSRSSNPRKGDRKKVARRGLYSTAALCIADCAFAPYVVPSFISREATTPSGAGALY